LQNSFLEALVIGHKPGKGNCTGMLGALECQLPNGKRFDVGSGFTMDQRRKPPKKGSVITFKFQELSNAGSPRFPVFLRLRTDLTWDDVLEAAKTKTPISVKQKVVPTTKLSKQHSILFSVIPSRDGKTGKKIAKSDDDDDEQPSSSSASSSSLQKPDAREECPYGEKCYRKNPDHLKQYQHPSSTTTTKPKLTKNTSRTKSSSKSRSKAESEEPVSPTTTDNLLVKDKNKGRQFDDDDEEDEDDDQQQRSTPTKTNKRKRNLEEKSNIKPTRKRVKKS
jgi:hypothetical protein